MSKRQQSLGIGGTGIENQSPRDSRVTWGLCDHFKGYYYVGKENITIFE